MGVTSALQPEVRWLDSNSAAWCTGVFHDQRPPPPAAQSKCVRGPCQCYVPNGENK